MARQRLFCLVTLLLCAGCFQQTSSSTTPEQGDSAVPTESATNEPTSDADQKPMSDTTTEPAPRSGGEFPVAPPGSEPPATEPAPNALDPNTSQPNAFQPNATDGSTEQVEARAGVGAQGQSLQGETGVLVEAAKAYFNVRQRAVFEIQIPQAMQLFEATEGRKPQTQDEFMSRIVAANNIALPKLPAGHRYIYDPARGELMVQKPAK